MIGLAVPGASSTVPSGVQSTGLDQESGQGFIVEPIKETPAHSILATIVMLVDP